MPARHPTAEQLEFGAFGIGRPRRHAGIGDRRGGHIVEFIGNRHAPSRRRNCAFGHRAVGRAREQEIDAGAVVEPPHPVDADHERELAG
jgi:hypothetical protein